MIHIDSRVRTLTMHVEALYPSVTFCSSETDVPVDRLSMEQRRTLREPPDPLVSV